MIVEPARDWNVFKQIFVDHWQGFQQFRPRYDTPYYESLVEKMLDCGNPDKMGYIEYRCLDCGLCACGVPKSTWMTGLAR